MGPPNTDNNSSGGTWKMIKGKVSQTLEDIKSSKAPQQYPTITATFTKSGQQQHTTFQETADSEDEAKFVVIRTASEEIPPISLELKSPQPPPSPQRNLGVQQHKNDSESEMEHELLLDTDIEPSRLRRGLANLKSRVKVAKPINSSQPQPQQQPISPQQPQHAVSYQASTHTIKTMKKEASVLPAPSGGHSLRNTFLRGRRSRQTVETAELASPSSLLSLTTAIDAKTREKTKSKKNLEIETGVEMLEDTLTQSNASSGRMEGGSDIAFEIGGTGLPTDCRKCPNPPILHAENILYNTRTATQQGNSYEDVQLLDNTGRARPNRTMLQHIMYCIENFPYFIVFTMFIVTMLPIRDFIRGVLMCLLAIALLDSIWSILQNIIEYFIIQVSPQKMKFRIPDYSRMPIVEMPPIEEHKSVKTYKAFMNEIESYEPTRYHISMTKSVYVKLDGSMLHISSTTARIPKRAMWNEPPIDVKNITLTDTRTYNLLGCRLELLPLGLARKRYFNRKYPLQLIVKSGGPDTARSSFSVRPSPSSTNDVPPSTMQTTAATTPTCDTSTSMTATTTAATTSTAILAAVSDDESKEKLIDVPDDQSVDEDMEHITELDVSTTMSNTDLSVLQSSMNPDVALQDLTLPCGDETRILLFTRTDREKEDWYRRFMAASMGLIYDKDLNLKNMRVIDDSDLQASAAKVAPFDPVKSNHVKIAQDAQDHDNKSPAKEKLTTAADNTKGPEPPSSFGMTPDQLGYDELDEDSDYDIQHGQLIDGLLMTWCVGRNPPDYVKFMTLYQLACRQAKIPVYKGPDLMMKANKHARRMQRKQNELWQGIDQSLFLGPSGSVVWANVLIGRVLFSCLHDPMVLGRVQDLLQKKLATVRLPSFMEEVVITQINLGKTPPLIHRVSQPMLDERGIWVDADCTYEGLVQITITTKLNLLRLKKQTKQAPATALAEMVNPVAAAAATALPTVIGSSVIGSAASNLASSNPIAMDNIPSTSNQWCPIASEEHLVSEVNVQTPVSTSAIYDSDAESSGGSSSESDSMGPTTSNNLSSTDNPNSNDQKGANSSPGNARRIFKIVDRITASNFFQYATELSYVQRAMENMNANITLRIDVKGCVGRAVVNIPPPPSDRIWISFRGPPRLWLSAKPTVGDKSMDWSIVTNVIESKLCELVNKHLVYPNMTDFSISLLAHPTYGLPTD